MKHTPGPWEVHYKFNVQVCGTSRGIATTGGYTDNRDGGQHAVENEANANLIAAAPELLEACEKSLRVLEYISEFSAVGRFSGSMNKDTCTQLRATIAKAKGETE